MIDPVDLGDRGPAYGRTTPGRRSRPVEDAASTPGAGPDGERRHRVVRCANVWEFACWLLDEHRRAAWGLAYVLVVLGAAVGVTGMVAPHLGGALGTAFVLAAGGMGGVGVRTVRRRWRERTVSDRAVPDPDR